MSWASKRRTSYILGILLFFAVFVGIPTAVWIYEPPNCFDGVMNQDETAVDKGGPCAVLDERSLAPYSSLWSRGFPSRDGTYSAVAYIENSNANAGTRAVSYRFGLYDDRNVLIAERTGKTYIMPGGITPVFEGGIQTGNRVVARTYFEFTSNPVFERMQDASGILLIDNKEMRDTEIMPRLSASVFNTSVADVISPSFVAVVYDPAGNAFAASGTTLVRLSAGEKREIVFTWSDPFVSTVGRIDVLPVLPPLSLGR